ncbi:MAG: hypothetical protein CL489_06235 [Acidobacteria bacterium]|nr:hypothetical protein [Acidobacteriota bacterium]|tara:strand:- start:36242 stop:36631 length:390 start_codon:yes stop_codon:yes gene_type:complete
MNFKVKLSAAGAHYFNGRFADRGPFKRGQVVTLTQDELLELNYPKAVAEIKLGGFVKHFNTLKDDSSLRHFRHPNIDGEWLCPVCHCSVSEHAILDYGDRVYTVCPGSVLIERNGELQPVPEHLVDLWT